MRFLNLNPERNPMIRLEHDLHVHTFLSECCTSPDQTPANIVRKACELGLKQIGFADHLWANPTVKPHPFYRRQDWQNIIRLREELALVEIPEGLQVLVGCEAEMAGPGCFGITPEQAESLDFVLLSTDHFYFEGFVEEPANRTPKALAEHMLSMFAAGAQSDLATALAHPLIPHGYLDLYEEAMAEVSDQQLIDTFGVAAANDVALEISGNYLPDRRRTHNFDFALPLRIISLAKRAGCRFTFGSDAHTLDGMERIRDLEFFISTLKLTAADLLPGLAAVIEYPISEHSTPSTAPDAGESRH